MNIPEVSFNKILYTTDLSEAGRHAFPYAASLAHQYNAKLTVIHVVEEAPELDSRLVGYMNDQLWEEIKKRDLEEARQILINRKRDNAAIVSCVGDYCEEIWQNYSGEQPYVSYDIVVRLGNPVEQIINYADGEKFDVIVVGSLGHSTLHDALLGSNVKRILRRSQIPVLVVRSPK